MTISYHSGERIQGITSTVSLQESLGTGSSGSGNTEFNTPRGVAVDSSGNIHVIDTYNHRVQKFNSAGTYQSTIGTGSSGTGNTELNYPSGIAVDSSDNVYVADTNNHRVQKFNSAGSYQLTIGTGSAGSGNTELNNPEGVSVDSSDNVYVGDAENDRVQKFNSSGTYQSTFGTGSEGTGNTQFNYPTGLDIDSSGNVYVADKNNHRVQKFNSSGTYLQTFGTTGSSGTSNSQFNNPFGVVVGSNGEVYVADKSNHRVQRFDSSGTYLQTYGTGSSGSSDSQFYSPHGVDVDSSSNVYVADTYNYRVQKFNASDTKPTDVPDYTRFEETDTRKMYSLTPATTLNTSDDFSSSSGWTQVTNTNFGVTGGELIGNSISSGTNGAGVWKDYGLVFDDEKFVFRCKFQIVTQSGQTGNASTFYFGISDTNGATSPSGNRDGFGIAITNYAASGMLWLYPDGTTWDNADTDLSLSPSANTYYLEIKRTSATSVTFTLYSDSTFTTVVKTHTQSIASTLDGLRYVMMQEWRNGSTNTTKIAVDDLKVYNGVSSVSAGGWKEKGTT